MVHQFSKSVNPTLTRGKGIIPTTILRAFQIFKNSYGPVGRALRTLKSAVTSVFHFTAIWSVGKNAFIHGKTQI